MLASKLIKGKIIVKRKIIYPLVTLLVIFLIIGIILIVEKDEKRCLELSEQFPKAVVICGDGTDQDLLKEEGISNGLRFLQFHITVRQSLI